MFLEGMPLAPRLCSVSAMFPSFAILAFFSIFATAQDAGQTGETELAQVASLHRSVYEPPSSSSAIYTGARQLGLRYIEGRGVERDQIQGCALFELAIWDSAAGRRPDAAARADAEDLKKLYCSGLSTDESEEAWVLASCGIFGVKPQVIALAPDSQLDISRRGLVLDTAAGRTTQPLISMSGGMVGCGNQVPLLRYTRVDPPVGVVLPSRHLLELAEWSSAADTTGSTRRMLHWSVFDITSKIEMVVASETLVEDFGPVWPMPALPTGLESGAIFTMQPPGEIHWEIPGEPTHSGTTNEPARYWRTPDSVASAR
jgi:hypothetical protein